MRVGVSLEPIEHGPAADLAGVAELVELAGLDAVSMSDHVLRSRTGPAFDPLVVLAAAAARTERLQLVTSILVLPLHDPVRLANQTATLDVLSRGRLALAVGTGWDEREFAALGIPRGERGARTDAHLDVLRALWRDTPVDADGPFTRLSGDRPGVAPTTPGGPPVWIGGHSGAALARVVRRGDGWHASGADPAALRTARSRLADLGAEAGRDVGGIELSSVCFLVPPGSTPTRELAGPPLGGPDPSTGSVVDALGALRAEGLSLAVLWMPLRACDLPGALEWFASDVRPHLG